MSGVYSDDQGPGSVLAAQMAVEDFGGRVAGQKIEVALRRPPEQARHRRPDRPRLVRQRGRRRGGRPAELGGRARGRRHRARPQQGDDRLGRRQLGDHRAEMHAQHRALDLRHLGLRPRARPRRHQPGRQERLLHHRRLRVRPRPRGAVHRPGEEIGREDPRLGAPPDRRERLQLAAGAGAELGRRRGRVRQCGRRHHQLAQAGGRVRPRQEAEAPGADHGPEQRARARPRRPRRARC